MKYIENFKVTSHEVDPNNNLRVYMVLRFMQEAADHQMRDRKPTYQELVNDGKSFVLSRMAAEIYGQINMYDDIRVETWQEQENNKGVTFVRYYEIYKGNELVARGVANWAMVATSTKRLCKLDEVDFSNYDRDQAVELTFPLRFRLDKSLKFNESGTIEVKYSHVDMNMHINNTVYARLIVDLIPEIKKKKVTSINIHFMKEAPLGEEVRFTITDNIKDELSFYNDTRAKELYGFRSFLKKGKNIEAIVGVEDAEKVTLP